MSTLPIIATAARPALFASPGGIDHGASAENSDFHNVLQQMSSSDGSSSATDTSEQCSASMTAGNDETASRGGIARDGNKIETETQKKPDCLVGHSAKRHKDAGTNSLLRKRTKQELSGIPSITSEPGTIATADIHATGRSNAACCAALLTESADLAQQCVGSESSQILFDVPAGTMARSGVISDVATKGAGLTPGVSISGILSDSGESTIHYPEDDSEDTNRTPTPVFSAAVGDAWENIPLGPATDTRDSGSTTPLLGPKAAVKSKMKSALEGKGDRAQEASNMDAANFPQSSPEATAAERSEIQPDKSATVLSATPSGGVAELHNGANSHRDWRSRAIAAGNNAASPEKKTGNGTVATNDSVAGSIQGPHLARVEPAVLQTTASSVVHENSSVTSQTGGVLPATHTADVPPLSGPQPKLKSYPIPDPPQMVRSGQLHIANNSSELKISVELPELGKVEVRAVLSHDVTTAHLTTAHHDALQVLAADRAGLDQVLKSRDVILGSLSSSAQDSNPQNSHGQPPGHQRPQDYSTGSFRVGPSLTTAANASDINEGSTTVPLPEYARISVRA